MSQNFKAILEEVFTKPELQNVKSLRGKGFTVKVGQKRWLKHINCSEIRHTPLRRQVESYLVFSNPKNKEWSKEIIQTGMQERIYPKGGETHLMIVSPCGKYMSEQTIICSEKDTFIRPVGLSLAIERALNDLNNQVIVGLFAL